jgi:cyclopropane-fatty-acyl-phospholipid synthase
LGNDFFEKMLDDTMSYSSGVFKNENTSLREASIEKLDLICRKLSLNQDDHLLEIGTGWGGLAIHAAKNYQCRVTSVTISKEQYDYAINKIKEENLEDLITVELKDYRKIKGQYSKLVSVEMIEAVGHQYYSEFFTACSRLVKPDGMFLLQAITIDDRYYDIARKSVDFIKKYIFPGCCIPSMAAISQHIKKDTDYQLYHMQDISLDYAKTLNLWNQNFQANKGDIQQLGYDDNFCRMWEYYLQYCEGGFIERAIGDVQLLYVKKDTRNITFNA